MRERKWFIISRIILTILILSGLFSQGVFWRISASILVLVFVFTENWLKQKLNIK